MNISPNAYFYGFYRIGIKPTLYDAWNLGKFVENNQLRGTWYYIFHLNHLKRDTQDMYWKIGQLKRVLKIKINYFRLQNLLDRFKS